MGKRISLIALLAFPCLLKSELLPIRTYTIADGLAAQHVDCIVPDSRRFIWFCTPEGLSRFDGYHFVTYGRQEGLPQSEITALTETSSGEYLVGTLTASRASIPADRQSDSLPSNPTPKRLKTSSPIFT